MAFHVFEIFPEEVWITIIDKTEDSMDWLNLSRTCTSLNELMKPSKCFALLPGVLKSVGRYLDRNQLLTLGLVCKRWKSAVYSNYEYKYTTLEFSNCTQIEKFISDMCRHVGNPFMESTILFRYSYSSDVPNPYFYPYEDKFWDFAQRLVKRFGKYIQNISLISDDHLDEDNAHYLMELLQSAPELEVLRIDFGHYGYDLERFYWFRIKPVFKCLKIIKLASMSGRMVNSMLEILHDMCVNPELVSDVSFKTCGVSSLPIMFPNLEVVKGNFDKEMLTDLRESQWRLRKLTNYNYTYPEEEWEFMETFGAFEQFAETLTTLKLKDKIVVNKSLLDNDVNLPNLKILSLDSVECNTLDFLRAFCSIEDLWISSFTYHRQQKKKVSKYYYDEGFFEIEVEENLFDIPPPEVKIIPYLRDYLTKNDFLRLRLVSYALKQAVDHVAEYTHMTFKRNQFVSENQIQGFLNKMKNHSGNPFVGRSVKINCEYYSRKNIREFWTWIFKLFKRFGREIHSLSWTDMFEKIDNEEDIYEAWRNIINLLRLTPNLKVLVVGTGTWCRNRNGKYIFTKEKSLPSLNNIIPFLQHLKCLHVTNCVGSDNKKYLLDLFHRMCCHPGKVTKLSIDLPLSSELQAVFPNVDILECEIDIDDLKFMFKPSD